MNDTHLLSRTGGDGAEPNLYLFVFTALDDVISDI